VRIASRTRLLRGIDGRFYASVPEGDRAECHELRSCRFGRWLTRAYHQEGNRILYPEIIRRVVGLLEAKAEHAGALETAYLRVGGGDTGSTGISTYYLDLGDHSRRAIAIGPGHWHLVDRPHVHFRRPDGFAALPTPSRDGSIDLLRKYANVADAEFPLLVAWLTAALRPVGPYPVLNLVGEQGSAKSTLARVARLLIDPHASPMRAEPESRRDLMVGARNNWLLAFDNLSALPGWLSDGLCRLATGGAFAARKLYDDDQEHHFSACRPVILNGISELARRGDLIDRSLFLNLPPIPDSRRQYEEELWVAFEADAPRLLGGLLEAVAGGLRLLPEIQLSSRPRMADFVRWGEGVAQALGQAPGVFLTVYLHNRHLASMTAVEDSPVARGVLELVARCGSWKGPASALLVLLRELIQDPLADVNRWPKSPIWLSEQLRRAAPQLRTCGVLVTFHRRKACREIRIEREKLTATAPS
jgi:hypothetical protein